MGRNIQLSLVQEQPITASQRKSVNGAAIIFKNSGDVSFSLDDTLTIGPGESIQFGTSDDLNVIWMNVYIRFDPETEGVNPLCEIAQLKASNVKGYSNYIPE